MTETAQSALADQLTRMSTERVRTDLADLDQRSTLAIAETMNDGDAQVAVAIRAMLPHIAAAVDAITERLRRGGRLIYIGAGTAGRLGVLDASECPPTFNTPPEQVVGVIAGGHIALTTAIEGAEDDTEMARADLAALHLTEADCIVGISASGRTPYAVAGVQYAAERGALTLGLSCNGNSALGAAAQIPLEVEVGPELVAGSTRLKSGTAQKLVLNMLSTITMIRLGKTYGNLMVDVRSTNEKLRARAHNIVTAATDADVDEVTDALAAADGEVKTAILMILAAVDAETANAALAEHGSLRAALAAQPRIAR